MNRVPGHRGGGRTTAQPHSDSSNSFLLDQMPQSETPTSELSTEWVSSEQEVDQGSSQSTQVAQTQSQSHHPDILTDEEVSQKSAIWQVGWAHGLSQGQAGLENIAKDTRTQLALAKASQATGVSEDSLTAMSIIESTGNRSVGTNAYGYTGLMQMGSDAAKDLGMSYSSLIGAENVENNALAGARYWGINDSRMDQDIPRDPLHMYLAHQQGAAGVSDVYQTVQQSPQTQAIGVMRNNLPSDVLQQTGWNPTYQEFYDYWSGKMAAIEHLIAMQKAQA